MAEATDAAVAAMALAGGEARESVPVQPAASSSEVVDLGGERDDGNAVTEGGRVCRPRQLMPAALPRLPPLSDP